MLRDFTAISTTALSTRCSKKPGHFAGEQIAPLNRVGDTHGTPFKDGTITMPPGWKEAYTAWAAAGWNGLAAPAQWGGQGLPQSINVACIEMWNAASAAFGVGPILTMAGIDALAAHGSDELKRIYLPKLISGEWMGTMQLTEPQAGSDVGALRTKAERAGDGTYRITGQKIFITYGEHDLTDNIIHLVLARLPDAPPGTRGISLFVVPKFLVNADGSLGDTQRCPRAFDRTQDGHSRLADLHDGVRRQRRRCRLPRRRGKSRHVITCSR